MKLLDRDEILRALDPADSEFGRDEAFFYRDTAKGADF